MRLTFTLALALFSLAGCGGDESSAATLKGPIQYSRSGGFAGVTEKMTIQPDGRGETSTLTRKRSFKLTAEQRRDLAAAVRKADLEHAKSPKSGPGADALNYSIRYQGHRVGWSDLSDAPPKAVGDLYTRLGRLYRANVPR